MIELAKAFLDFAAKIAPVGDIIKQRRADKIADMGLRLFDIVNKILDVVENGHKVLNNLGLIVECHDKYYASGVLEPLQKVAHELSLILNEQFERIGYVQQLTFELRELANITDMVTTESMHGAILIDIDIKSGILSEFGGVRLGNGATLLAPEFREVELLESRSLARSLKDLGASLRSRMRGETREEQLHKEFFERQASIDKIPWQRKTNDLAKLYLKSGAAKRNLENLKSSALSLRSSLQKTFKVEDILLAADRRSRTSEQLRADMASRLASRLRI